MKVWSVSQYRDAKHLANAYRDGERPRLDFTRHFVSRMRDMGVSEDEVFECVSRPEKVTVSERYGSVNLKHGRITAAVLVDEEGFPFAATLLFRHMDDWVDAAQAGTLGAGRELKFNPLLERRQEGGLMGDGVV